MNAGYAKAGILQSICKTLENHGFRCVSMVGHSDFHVDIAVEDPYEPARYLMGILLDGDVYRQTGNTRDREVAQMEVLKNLGWVLYRVWTIDWWDNRDKVLRKLTVLLEKLKAESQKKHEAEEARSAESAAALAGREEQEAVLREELAKQAAEVLADEEEPEEEHPEADEAQEPEEEHPETAEPQRKEDFFSETCTEADGGEEQDTESARISELYKQLKAAGAEVVDKRKNGGALWIIGGKSLNPIMRSFREIGVHFIFKAGGGKATKGRDGWWAKTDMNLPTKDEAEK